MNVTLAQIKDDLQTAPFFSALGEEDLNALAGIVQPRRVPKRGLVFSQGQECEGLFLVSSGRVKIFRLNPVGNEQVLHVIHAGQFFAEAALFSGTGYPASAATLDDCTLYLLPRDLLLDLLRDRPQVSLKMLTVMSQWLRHLVGLLEDVSLSNVDTRLRNYLFKLAHLDDQAANGSALLTLPMPKNVLAMHLGMTPPTLSRALARLEEAGLIQQAPEGIRVPDLSAMGGDVHSDRSDLGL